MRYCCLLLKRGAAVLDVLGIFVSGVMMLYIIIRAVQLDATRPWFEPLQPDADEPAASCRPGRAPRAASR